MPKAVFDQLNYSVLTQTPMQLQLADSSVGHSEGTAEDVPVRVRDYFVPVDFVVLLAFLKSIPALRRPRQQPQNCLLVVLSAITRNEGAELILATAPKGCHSRGIINTITDGSTSARIYRCSISPGE